jgi:Flp pilus assembly protein TadD
LQRVALFLALSLIWVMLLACSDREAESQPGDGGMAASAEPTPTVPLDAALTSHFRMIEAGRSGPARVRIRQWLLEHPDDPRGLFLMGLSHHQDKRYSMALPWLAEATQTTPVYPPAWHFRGWSHLYLGQIDEARDAFNTHLSLVPDEGDSHFALGLLALEDWKLNEAQRRFQTAIDLQSTLPHRVKGVSKARARLAQVLQQRDADTSRAIELLRESVALWPDHYEAWYRLSQLLANRGDVDGAELANTQYRQALHRVRPGTAFPE